MTDYREELARQVRDAAGPHNDNDLPVITVVMRMEGEIQRLTDQLEQAQNGLRAVIELAARHQRTAGSGDEMFIEGLQSAAWKAQEFLPTKITVTASGRQCCSYHRDGGDLDADCFEPLPGKDSDDA